MAHPVPLKRIFLLQLGKKHGEIGVLRDGMEHVYLCGNHFCGNTTHINSMLLGIGM